MLFGRIRLKTMLQIMMPILFSLFLACLTILAVVSRSYFGRYEEHAQQYITQKGKAAGLFLQLIEELSMQYSFDEEYTIRTLDLLKQQNKNILCTVYFEEEERMFVSSNVSGYPDYMTLTALPAVRDFLKSEQNDLWFTRKTAVSDYYDHKKYDEKRGVLTYLRKENNGVLAIEVDPSALFGMFDNNTGDQKSSTLIQSDGLILYADAGRIPAKDEQNALLELVSGTESNISLPGKSARIFRAAVTDTLTLTIDISYGYVLQALWTLMLPILLIFLAFSVITLFTSILLTRTVMRPMEDLYNKMRHEKLDDISEE